MIAKCRAFACLVGAPIHLVSRRECEKFMLGSPPAALPPLCDKC